MGEESKVYSYSEVSSHNTPEDCWVIINAKVYNVTSYLNEHPGGDEVIMAAAGTDASQEFEDVGHGSAARLMLDEFYVGEVDPTVTVNPPVEASSTTLRKEVDVKPSKSTKSRILYFLLALAIILLGVGIQFNLSTPSQRNLLFN